MGQAPPPGNVIEFPTDRVSAATGATTCSWWHRHWDGQHAVLRLAMAGAVVCALLGVVGVRGPALEAVAGMLVLAAGVVGPAGLPAWGRWAAQLALVLAGAGLVVSGSLALAGLR